MADFFGTEEVKLLRGPSLTPVASVADALAGKKYVLVYFSAHWCPPCRAFTSRLKSFYDQFSKEKNFEIVFVSLDRSAAAMADYIRGAHGDWLAMSFESAQSIGKHLFGMYGLRTIPTLLVFRNNGWNGEGEDVLDASGVQLPEGKKKGDVYSVADVERGSCAFSSGGAEEKKRKEKELGPRTLVTSGGCAMVYQDRDAADFPWPDGDAVASSKTCAMLRMIALIVLVSVFCVYCVTMYVVDVMATW